MGWNFFVRYSKLELVLANSKLKFIVDLEFPTTSLKRCLSMEFQFFGSFLSKSAKPKLLSISVDSYIGFPMLATKFFLLIEVFDGVSFSIKTSLKSFLKSSLRSKSSLFYGSSLCFETSLFSLFSKSSLCFLPPLMVVSNSLGTCPKYQ